MMDLTSSGHVRGGLFEKSRTALGSQSTGRLNREARETKSFLSQSQSDIRSVVQGAWARDDQFLNSRGYGSGGSSSITLGRQEILPSRSSSFLRGRTLSGFDGSRGSGFLQTGSSYRSDQLFLPSVGILGGLSQARGGAFGGSFIGNYSGQSGLHSGFGFQRLMTGPTFYGQGAASGFDGRLNHSASLSSLHQQLPTQIQGSASNVNAAFQQVAVDVTRNSNGNSRSVATSAEDSQQFAASRDQQAVGCRIGGNSFVAPSSGGASTEVQGSDLEVNENGASPAKVNASSQQVEDQAANEYEIADCTFSADVDQRDNVKEEESHTESAHPISCEPSAHCGSTSQDATDSVQPDEPNHKSD